MGRQKQRRPLLIYANGDRVGTWEIDTRGTHAFSYHPSWVSSPRGRPLSLSLPFLPGNRQHTGDVVSAYFENLLPDNVEILRRVQARFGTSSIGAFDILSEIGRDCVGAIQIFSGDQAAPDVHSISGTPLTESEIARLLEDALVVPGLMSESRDEFRISIAGAQEKTALLYHDGQWMRPRGATPTTHILKLPLGKIGIYGVDLTTSPENEWLCGRIFNAFGLSVPDSTVMQFEGRRVLVVTRFDRTPSGDGTWIVRRPVEDFCQATGTPPSQKYESDGGPGIGTIMEILGASDVTTDRQTFLTAQILMWMLASTDGHGKNFSIFLDAGGRFRLTPFYDVISAWPVVGSGPERIPLQRLRMAMAVTGKNRHYRWDTITPRHWIETSRRNGIPQSTTNGIIESLVENTESVIRQVVSELPAGFPESTATAVFEGLRNSAERLGKGLEAGS